MQPRLVRHADTAGLPLKLAEQPVIPEGTERSGGSTSAPVRSPRAHVPPHEQKQQQGRHNDKRHHPEIVIVRNDLRLMIDHLVQRSGAVPARRVQHVRHGIISLQHPVERGDAAGNVGMTGLDTAAQDNGGDRHTNRLPDIAPQRL
jgi:hypothetical protein